MVDNGTASRPLMDLKEFWQGRRVFVTGHTGFKGAWLSFILQSLGAVVTGYSLRPPTVPNLYDILNLGDSMVSLIGDIRDHDTLSDAVRASSPEILLHLAAQPLVLAGYEDARYTYETNVMGTVNVLEAARQSESIRSLINVTTDKVYLNLDKREHAFVEDEPLDGYDPYSNSKSCSELVTATYRRCFFAAENCSISTVRAGNVIGGGDFAEDRIIPDCIRAAQKGTSVSLRNPSSIRPYQHVLEPLFAYLMIAKAQFEDSVFEGSYNVGPDICDCITTSELVTLLQNAMGVSRECDRERRETPHEATFLKLDTSKLQSTFGWKPRWHIDEAVAKTAEWYRAWLQHEDIVCVMSMQINDYLEA